ncbi:hypothetical protein [Streptomyces sp. UG1]|uniref:hypothetical protein n=1 Tax=Streptomyces sp. UG1 TaxID=3417652 RepID=UPI003CFA671A
MAIILLVALFLGGAAAVVFWAAGRGSPVEARVKGALAAGGMTFLGVASLGVTVGIFLSG